jgi:hypothetical protein
MAGNTALTVISAVKKFERISHNKSKSHIDSDSPGLTGTNSSNATADKFERKGSDFKNLKRGSEMYDNKAVEQEEEYEVRGDGMQEVPLLTFSFYAPWVKISQLNASKKRANDIRSKARVYQLEGRKKKVLISGSFLTCFHPIMMMMFTSKKYNHIIIICYYMYIQICLY